MSNTTNYRTYLAMTAITAAAERAEVRLNTASIGLNPGNPGGIEGLERVLRGEVDTPPNEDTWFYIHVSPACSLSFYSPELMEARPEDFYSLTQEGRDEVNKARRERALLAMLRELKGSAVLRVKGTSYLVGILHGIGYELSFGNALCERVQTGTRTVMRPDPETPLVEVEEPTYEWRCSDNLLGRLNP